MAFITGILLWCGTAARAGGDELPDSDLAAIARLAQRVGPEKSYAGSLPARRRECIEAATPYRMSGVPDRMAWGERMLIECYAAMLIKLADVYYDSETFGPGGMPALADRLLDDPGQLYQGIHDGPIDCLRNCGSILYLIWSGHQGAEFDRAVEAMAMLQVPESVQEQWLTSWNRAGWVK